MDILQAINTLSGPVAKLVGWLKSRSNPIRQQAARIIQTFKSHGIERTQINLMLPKELQFLPYQLSTPDELIKAFRFEHIEWLADQFALEMSWLEGASEMANQEISSYKQPAELHKWLDARQLDENRLSFKLHLLVRDIEPISSTSNDDFAVVLEEFFDVGEDYHSRYYHLTHGAHLQHYPCVLHLMQIMAIAHFHGAIMRRSVLSGPGLKRLSLKEGLIVDHLIKTKPHPFEADHELWGHYSGQDPWLQRLREECEISLLHAGLVEVAATLRQDRKRFARPNTLPAEAAR